MITRVIITHRLTTFFGASGPCTGKKTRRFCCERGDIIIADRMLYQLINRMLSLTIDFVLRSQGIISKAQRSCVEQENSITPLQTSKFDSYQSYDKPNDRAYPWFDN